MIELHGAHHHRLSTWEGEGEPETSEISAAGADYDEAKRRLEAQVPEGHLLLYIRRSEYTSIVD